VAPQATYLVIALNPTQETTSAVVVVVVVVVAVETTPAEAVRSATNVGKLDTLLAIARKVEVIMVAVMADASKLATPAVVMATWRVTALKAKSATTAAKLVMSHAIAPPMLVVSECATSANSLATFRQLVLISSGLQFIRIVLSFTSKILSNIAPDVGFSSLNLISRHLLCNGGLFSFFFPS